MMKQRLIQVLGATALVALLSGCGEAPNQQTTDSSNPTTTPSVDTTAPETSVPENTSQPAVTIPAGARAGSADFPFPVPESWAELDPFAEEKVGKDIAMYAAYEYPGEATAAAEHYKSLLSAAGYQVRDDPLGALTNQAALWVEGPVNGEPYHGGITFDSHADGSQRAIIHLTLQD